MTRTAEILDRARQNGRKSLSEYESKLVLADYGVPVTREKPAQSLGEAREAAREIGFPVAVKVCSPEVTHKTDRGLIELDIRGENELEAAWERLLARLGNDRTPFLIQEMVKGTRELVAGMVRDPQFGPCVMFGLGGVFTEVLGDVVFRVAPLEEGDAREMIADIRGHHILGAVRGMEAVDQEALASILTGLGLIGAEHPTVREIDVNPLIVRAGRPVAVDALVVLRD